MYPIILLLIAVAVSVVHLYADKRGYDNKRLVEVFLMYFLVIFVGITGLLGFAGHAFMADKIAKDIGWPVGSPFQFEVAMCDLSYGLLGIMCFWMRGNFWTAVGVGSSLYLLGAAYGHAKQLVVYKDMAPYNVGPVFYIGDILVPLIVLALVIAYNVIEVE